MVDMDKSMSYSLDRFESPRGLLAHLYPCLKWRKMNRSKRWGGQA